jgi:hypothetical protein
MSAFATPATATGIDWNDANGSLLLIEPLSIEVAVKTSLGEKDAVRANVAVLDGTLAGEQYSDVLIFPRVLQGQVRSRLGQKVLGRLGQGVAKAGQSAPWMLSEATEADTRLGMQWIARGVQAPAAVTEAADPKSAVTPAAQTPPAWAQQASGDGSVPF